VHRFVNVGGQNAIIDCHGGETTHMTGLMTGKLLSGAPAYVARTPWSAIAAVASGFVVLVIATILAIALAIGSIAAQAPDFLAIISNQQALEAVLKSPAVLAVTTLGWQVCIILMVLLVARWYGAMRRDVLALQSVPSIPTVLLAVVGGMLLTAPFDVLGLTIMKETAKADTISFIPMVRSQWWPVFAVAIAIGAPLSEELLFRGFLQSALAKTGIGFIGATILTAAGWTLLHIQYSWFGLAQVFVIGLYLSWLLWRSGTLWLPIAVHAIYNSISFTLLKFGIIGG
jgi:uncharacterized protein